MKVKLSDILQGGPLWHGYIIRQSTWNVFNTGKIGPKQLFKMVLLDSTLLFTNNTVSDFLTPKDFAGFQYQCKKNAKNEDFGLAV